MPGGAVSWADPSMPHVTIRTAEPGIGHLANQTLDEAILAALRRTGVLVEREHLMADQGAQGLGQGARVDTPHRGQSLQGERLPEHRGVLDEFAIDRFEAIEPRSDHRDE